MLKIKKPRFGFPWTVKDVKNMNDLVEEIDTIAKATDKNTTTIEELIARIEALETP